ncbi:TIGR04211 family SH3 domain-containing protein [Psychromonas sp. MB-3u-54]|uniref:TIGR04211 family SH3 domain-containing protein n=1 Tax=Psychromonas sp. MB-3u-54 TaxID=2058319 RepID=UPI001E439246|nr:TIGR04211 family SH3 domain-containing protein [Psychromonas sp. MB-3u-54]
MKIFTYITTVLSLMLCMNAAAETRYVSDDIFIYMHSGPSREYRIIGTLDVGSPVTTLKLDKKTHFYQVKTANGKTAWVKGDQLQTTLPANKLLPAIQKELQEAQIKLQNIDQKNSEILDQQKQSIIDKDSLIATLKDEKNSLQETIIELKAANLELDLLQDTKDERVKMEWMMYGGSVLFIGLLFGLLIPFLPRRKKNNNNW